MFPTVLWFHNQGFMVRFPATRCHHIGFFRGCRHNRVTVPPQTGGEGISDFLFKSLIC